jgi:transposase InsO family protein
LVSLPSKSPLPTSIRSKFLCPRKLRNGTHRSVNAPSETLFASLKVERLHGQRFHTVRQAKDETLDWLLWYNQSRMHSTIDYFSPMQFEQQWQRSQQALAS